jgi:plastocyanin domain-containing protein
MDNQVGAPVLRTQAQSVPMGQNVYDENGVQVIEIVAKGIYTPELTNARAGVPAVLRIITKDTFDCTSYVAIPSIGYQRRMPLTGQTDIELGVHTAGTSLTGLCGMAMYRFDIAFAD